MTIPASLAKRLSIKEAWIAYADRVLPVDCDPVQVTETRRGFYSGAIALLGILERACASDVEYAAIESLRVELDAYVREAAR